jgi:ferredoxin
VKVTVDENVCIGCGLCVNACPECFEMNENSIAVVKNSECKSCDLHEVASQCPVNAIVVED